MAEALLFPPFEMSLLSLVQTDGQAVLHLIYRTKHSRLQGLETPVLETCTGDRLSLSARLIPDKMMSQDQAWPLGHAPDQVPELGVGLTLYWLGKPGSQHRIVLGPRCLLAPASRPCRWVLVML